MSTARLIARLMAVLAISILGCQSIVGIEQREYDPPPPPKEASAQCKQYCADLLRVCTGTDAPYSTKEACLATCALLPPGDPTEPSDGNSVECRQRQIALAELGEHSLNCPRAGPGGDGVCGKNCESYCYLFNAACSTISKPLPNCVEACSVLRDTKKFDVVVNHDGDTLQCRLVHVSNSAANPRCTVRTRGSSRSPSPAGTSRQILPSVRTIAVSTPESAPGTMRSTNRSPSA